MPVMSFSVPRRPSRQTMKAIRKAAAHKERQNTTVQLSGASMNWAIAPPKLQKIADRATSTKPMRSSCAETAWTSAGTCCRSVASLMMRMAAK